MKKKFIIILLLLICMLPIGVAKAANESSANGQANNYKGCSGASCQCGVWMRSDYYNGALRITVVDKYGLAVAEAGGKSYDFSTRVRDTSSFKTNVFNGDKGKYAMTKGKTFQNFTAGSITLGELPKFSKLVSSTIKYLGSDGENYQTSAQRSTLGNNSDSGGRPSDSYKNERDWLLSLTTSKNPEGHAQRNINAFVRALAEITGAFDPEKLILRIEEACRNEDEIFVIFEPLFHYTKRECAGGWTNMMATLPDTYGYQLYLWTHNLHAKTIYYQNPVIPAFEQPLYNNFQITSLGDLLDNSGFGVGLLWVTDPGEMCSDCKWDKEKKRFTHDQQAYTMENLPSSFSSIPEFAFTDEEEGGAGCCDAFVDDYELGTLEPDWKAAFEDLCMEPPEGCCEPEAPLQPVYIDVNNCCTDDTHSEIREIELDDLFCYSERVEVEHYLLKCKGEFYEDEEMPLNDYCKVYCTERVTVDLPGAITAISGRYFELTESSKGTTSPYVEGFRRCRMLTEYDKWENDYGAKVDQQVANYNENQRLLAIHKMYKEAVPTAQTISGSGTARASCYTIESYPGRCSDGKGGTKPCTKYKTTCTDSTSETFDYSFTLWTFPLTKEDYFPVKVNEEKRKKYTDYEIEDDTVKYENHPLYSVWEMSSQVAKAEAAKASAISSCGCQTKSGSRDTIPHENDLNENVPVEMQKYKDKADAANASYNAAADEAKDLEEQLTYCQTFFDEQDTEAEIKEIYDLEPQMSFSYGQMFLNDFGEVEEAITGVPFKERQCKYERILDEEETGDPDEIKEDRYSKIYSKYTKEIENATDFKSTTLEFKESAGAFKGDLDELYEAEKHFTNDAKFHIECWWEEEENTIMTLVPNGYASESTSEMNYTVHERQYSVFLTTFDGTYETYWDMSGLGHQGKFDKYFLNGNTCANEDPADVSMFTCKLHVEYEVVLTGYCNGSNGTDTTVDPDDCDPYKEMYNLFTFKVVDPSNLFPSGTSANGEEYAYNWINEPKGQEVLGTIQEAGQRDATYSNDLLTYSFNLTPADMKQIKSYNEMQEMNGGYSDFNMNCECPSGVNTGTGCIQCKSYFIENLANGYISFNGNQYDMTGWANSEETLGEVRNHNHW